MDFIAIDFETANQKHDSPCSLGITIVKENCIEKSVSILINPEDEFSHINSLIHKITADDVVNAPTFPMVWDEIKHLFVKYPVVAHNVPFDKSVLEKVCKKYKIELPEILYFCTLELSRQNYPNLDRHTLDSLCEYFEISLNNHHECCCDSLACAELMIMMLENNDCDVFANTLNASYHKNSDNKKGWNNFGVKPIYKQSNTTYSECESIQFKNKKFVITGEFEDYTREEIIDIIESNGGISKNTVTKSTNYLIVGMQDINVLAHSDEVKSNKIIKAEALQAQGSNIKIISLETLLNCIEKELEECHDWTENEVLEIISNIINPQFLETSSLFIKKSQAKEWNFNTYNSIMISLESNSYRLNCANNFLFARINATCERPYMSFNKKFENLFKENNINYKLNKNDFFLKVSFSIFREPCLNVLPDIFNKIFIDSFNFASFGCCGHYIECSNSKSCVHPDIIYASCACMYKKHLDDGRIFYGKNKSI